MPVPFKQPWEKYPIDLNFAKPAAGYKGLDTGETILTEETKAWDGTTDVTSSIISSVSIDGQKLQVWIQGGEAGKRYKITAKITSSEGQKLEMDHEFDVKEK